MKHILSLMTILFLFTACNKEDQDVMQITPTIDPPSIEINASVTGKVIDEAGVALVDATITYGNIETQTNELGYFSISNAKLYQDGTYLTVDKAGYFQGSRTFYPRAGQTSNITVQMIEKKLVGTINQDGGGSVSFQSASVEFPSGDYTTKDGSSYNGEVNVYAKWLDPTTVETANEMPGDLSGFNSEGEIQVLASYGMMTVELESTSGAELNMPEGTSAKISMDVPASLEASAPETIPLWHFDEESGIWVEEGSAELVNGVYEGEVSHFTFWNCDVPMDYVHLEGDVYYFDAPFEGALVRVTQLSNGVFAQDYTNSAGYYSGIVPGNEPLKIEILDPCFNAIASRNIGPFSNDATEPVIVVDQSLNLENVTVTGTITNCTGDQIDQSYAIIKTGEDITTSSTDANGYFTKQVINCNGGDIEVYGVDRTNDLISLASTFTNAPVINAGTLEACEDFFTGALFVEYEGMNWGMDQDTSLVGYSVDRTDFVNGSITTTNYQVTIIDWVLYDPNVGFRQFYIDVSIDSDNPGGQVPYTAGSESQGFTITGMGEFSIYNQGGKTILRLRDVTDQITVTDQSRYPGNVQEVSFDVSF